MELIAGRVDKTHVTFELEDDAEVIAMDWGLDQIKVGEIMRSMVELELFQLDEVSNKIVCLKLANRLDESAAKNPEIRAAINQLRANNVIGSTSKGLVYLIQSGDKYKIGKTTNLHRRLRDYSTTNPDAVLLHTIETVDAGFLETTLHKRFVSTRILKSEWFYLSESDLAEVKAISCGDNYIADFNNPESFGKVSGPDKIRLDKTKSDKTKQEEIKEKKTPRKRDVFISPEWIPDDLWTDYLKSRKEKKHPMNSAALTLCVAAIEKCVDSGIGVDVVLTHMIEAGWRSCKPSWFDEPSSNFSSNKPKKETTDEFAERITRERNERIARESGSLPNNQEVVSEQ